MIEIGDARQLFVDDLLIHSLDSARLKMHEPVHRENVLHLDRPWEGPISWCPVVLKEGDRYRMWYRARYDGGPGRESFTCYAESDDGIRWTRPSLRLVAFEGSRENNICIATPDANNVAVFRDERSGVPDGQRYKAVGRWGGGRPSRLYGLVSPDGIRWEMAGSGPLMVAPEEDPQFDSPVGAFWDAARERYVVYARGWHPPGGGGIRAIRRSTSTDFVHWEPWRYIAINDESTWHHHLYTNSAHPYYRAPYCLMFPKRFIPDRKFHADWSHDGQSDVVFMAGRDGLHFRQLFQDAFLRPGPDPKNWHERSIFIGSHVVQTAPGEMSMYSVQNYRTEDIHIRRLTLREDGFVSVNAPFEGGTLITRPFTFKGRELELNYATGGAGSLRVEIQDPNGKALPGYAIRDCDEIFGDEIARVVRWNGRPGIDVPADTPIRLRFVLHDADLYSFRFLDQQPVQGRGSD